MNGHGSGQSWNFKEPKSSLQINRHVRWLLYTRELIAKVRTSQSPIWQAGHGEDPC